MFKTPFCIMILLLLINITELVDWKKYIRGTRLDARILEIDSLAGLENYSFLTYIELGSNKIENIRELKPMASLVELSLSRNKRIQSIESLSNLVNLKFLFLNQNKIKNMQPVCNLYNLEMLNLDENKITL